MDDQQIFTDPDIVRLVQDALRKIGYVNGGPVDGELGIQTTDEILSFRARNNLPLRPVIDRAFLLALHDAPPKEIPQRQSAATVEHIAESVEAVKTNTEVANVTWWQKLWAYIVGAPSVALAIVAEMVDKFGDATEKVTPVRQMFAELPVTVWLGLFVGISFIFGYQAYRIKQLSDKAQASMVAGYKIGTVKNDAPMQKEVVQNGKL